MAMATKTEHRIQPLIVPNATPSARLGILGKSSVGSKAARGLSYPRTISQTFCVTLATDPRDIADEIVGH
jgi:hypothetical protein